MNVLLENLRESESVYYGRLAGIWVMLLHRPPSEADMLLARPSLQEMLKSAPLGFPTLTWVLPTAGFALDARSKDVAAKITKEFSKSITARATLISASGFQAAAVRAIVTSIDLFTRSTSPGKVFSVLEDSVVWSQGFITEKRSRTESALRVTRELETLARRFEL